MRKVLCLFLIWLYICIYLGPLGICIHRRRAIMAYRFLDRIAFEPINCLRHKQTAHDHMAMGGNYCNPDRYRAGVNCQVDYTGGLEHFSTWAAKGERIFEGAQFEIKSEREIV